ncbi:nucleoside deaminase [Lapidilactobacillus wuchangensis]|uniref:nucleoside deaminase n=1 Tax=Lapidilactobacillus wuchangensis TaxID=2486001 RepID=UPI000F793AD8|nr:nucleoside deaminase [Lapidilactobacillus wuchangensis]
MEQDQQVTPTYQANFMSEATAEALGNVQNGAGGPFGAVVVRDGHILAAAHNQVLENHDSTAHGEIVAIRQACAQLGSHDLSGCILYTNAYPCPMCLSAIVWANIKTVYYGNTAEDAAAIGFRDADLYHYIENGCQDAQVLDLEQHDHEMTIQPFHEFAAKKDKQLY